MEEMRQVCGVRNRHILYKQRPTSEYMHEGGRDEEETYSFTGVLWEQKLAESISAGTMLI